MVVLLLFERWCILYIMELWYTVLGCKLQLMLVLLDQVIFKTMIFFSHKLTCISVTWAQLNNWHACAFLEIVSQSLFLNIRDTLYDAKVMYCMLGYIRICIIIVITEILILMVCCKLIQEMDQILSKVSETNPNTFEEIEYYLRQIQILWNVIVQIFSNIYLILPIAVIYGYVFIFVQFIDD